MSDESVSVPVTLSAEEYDRLDDVADDPGELLREAGLRRVLLEESVAEMNDRRAGDEGPPPADRERGPPIAPVSVLVGFEPVAIDDGESHVVMDAGPEHANPMGTVHGGVLCDLGDAAMGMAYASTLDEDESFTTLELKVNYLRPVWEGRLEARGRVVEGGRTVGLVECDVTNDDGDLVARLSSTCMTLRGEQASGR